jgi:hypothetical protein
MNEPYIRPRRKLLIETEQQELARRLEEHIEYADAVKNYSNRAFYEKLLAYIVTEEGINE